MRDDRERLRDMLDAITRIEKYAARGRQAFEGDELIQTWMRQNLQVIGEAARALSSEFRNQHPEIEWSDAIGMRNILVHHYFGVDRDLVWSAIEDRLPELKRKIEVILQASPD